MDIGFTSSAIVPTWLGGNGQSNVLPVGVTTGEIQNRFYVQSGQTTFTKSDDWSFDSSRTNPADWDHVTVHYQGDVICWGFGPEDSQPTATPTPTPTPVQTPVNGNLGDVNGDNSIDIVDALLVAQYYVGLDPDNFNPDNADVNCDGRVDISDALLVAQYYVGLVTEFC